MLGNHGDPIPCKECSSLAFKAVSEQFAFAITRRKDGSTVDPPFLGVIMLGRCPDCEYEGAIIDSPLSPEHWAGLPKWEKELA